jgi:hypothetical protein
MLKKVSLSSTIGTWSTTVISYSTNWMGPISTKWYDDRDIPFVMKKTSGKHLPAVEYKDYLESYSCGRIDIYGLDSEEYYAGKNEYGVSPMRTEDWNDLSDWLDTLDTYELTTYEDLIDQFEHYHGKPIRWYK